MDRRDLAQRKKRIGRKAIATVRVAVSIDRKLNTDSPVKCKFRVKYAFRRWHLYAAGALVIVLIAGAVVTNMVTTQVAVQKAAEEARLQKIEEQKAKDREACRTKILAEKADQLGTMTYDQLYGDQCR